VQLSPVNCPLNWTDLTNYYVSMSVFGLSSVLWENVAKLFCGRARGEAKPEKGRGGGFDFFT